MNAPQVVGALLPELLAFIAGLVLLVLGAEALVRGGSAIAGRLGMSPLVVGLTIVALGTSAPELIVSVTASATGHPDVALGNVVGSNILNTFVVLGCMALVAPIAVRGRTVRQDMPLVALVSLLLVIMAADGHIAWMEGGLLLAMLLAYLHHLYERERGRDYQPVALDDPRRRMLVLAVAGLVGGVLLLVWGGDLVVAAGSSIAASLGVPERVIALTLVAMGTSAPELVTSLVAAFRNRVDLAVGNVVGSNLLNLLLVLGAAALAGPIPVPAQALWLDMGFMVLGAVVLMQFASTRFRITRWEGGVLLALYGVYLGVILGMPN